MTSEASVPGALLTGLLFASNKHRHQRRKDGEASPYINHPIAVTYLLATTGEVSDIPTLTAAMLHDTIEDTQTTPRSWRHSSVPRFAISLKRSLTISAWTSKGENNFRLSTHRGCLRVRK